jgi:hypothetical protein
MGGRRARKLPENFKDDSLTDHDQRHELQKGRIKRVHVNSAAVQRCAKGESEPCLTIQTSRGVWRCHEVRFHGTTDLIERIHKPLSSGARIWLETRGLVEVLR